MRFVINKPAVLKQQTAKETTIAKSIAWIFSLVALDFLITGYVLTTIVVVFAVFVNAEVPVISNGCLPFIAGVFLIKFYSLGRCTASNNARNIPRQTIRLLLEILLISTVSQCLTCFFIKGADAAILLITTTVVFRVLLLWAAIFFVLRINFISKKGGFAILTMCFLSLMYFSIQEIPIHLALALIFSIVSITTWIMQERKALLKKSFKVDPLLFQFSFWQES